MRPTDWVQLLHNPLLFPLTPSSLSAGPALCLTSLPSSATLPALYPPLHGVHVSLLAGRCCIRSRIRDFESSALEWWRWGLGRRVRRDGDGRKTGGGWMGGRLARSLGWASRTELGSFGQIRALSLSPLFLLICPSSIAHKIVFKAVIN